MKGRELEGGCCDATTLKNKKSYYFKVVLSLALSSGIHNKLLMDLEIGGKRLGI